MEWKRNETLKIWSRQRIFLFVELVLLLTVLLAGCEKETTGVTKTGTRLIAAKVPKEQPMDDYLEEIEKLSEVVGELVEAGREFAAIGQSDPEDLEGMRVCVEQMREAKESFEDFAEETEPPAGLREAHAEMAQAVLRYAALIDEYCDGLLLSLEGEEQPSQEGLEARWEEAGASVAEAMEKMRRALSPFPAG